MPELLESLRTALAGRYAIQRELGRGGMAVVFLGDDLRHRRRVAIKVLPPEIAAALGGERFLREIEIAAGLTHPHILPLYDSGDAAGLLYYVMPYVEGESLRDRLSREKQLPVDEALRISREVADALAYAHARSVVHRDIKPENVLLQSGHAVVTDFGIARAISAAGGARLTQTGVAIGTIGYMSPEQATGEREVDGRSDIYSLGCVLYEMLAGSAPFTGPTVQAIMARLLTEAPTSLRSFRARVPERVEQAVLRALAPVPADRFLTASDFAAALGESLPAPRRWPRARISLALAGAAVLVVGGWAIALRLLPPGPPVSPNRLVVLPFAVSGAASAGYLQEGMVDLLSRSLDGAADLHAIDPGTVLTTLRKRANAPMDPVAGREAARRLGAGLYVLGSALGVGGRLRIQAGLYNGASEPLTRASVEGDTSDFFQLVDRLAGQLLATRQHEPAFRLATMAGLTTQSLSALKAYLDAEHDLRAGRPDSAIAGFERAVAADSSFSLAYYRLGVAAGWAGHPALADSATARAVATSGRLSARDRRLLIAHAAYRRGAVDEAERDYRAILDDYPDDLEGQFQLGDLLSNYNSLRGRPRTEARQLLDRVLAVDPGFL